MFHKAPDGWIRERDSRNPILLMSLLLLPVIIAFFMDRYYFQGGFFETSSPWGLLAWITYLVIPGCAFLWYLKFVSDRTAVGFERIYDDIDMEKVIVGIERSISRSYHPIERITSNPFGGNNIYESFIVTLPKRLTLRVQAIIRPKESFLQLMVFPSKHRIDGIKGIMDALLLVGEDARILPETVKANDNAEADPSSVTSSNGSLLWYSEARWWSGAMAVTLSVFALVFFTGILYVLERGKASADIGDLGHGILLTQLMIAIAWTMSLDWFKYHAQGIAYSHSRVFPIGTKSVISSLEGHLKMHRIQYSCSTKIDAIAREVLRFDLKEKGRRRTFIDIRLRPSPYEPQTTTVTIGTTSSPNKVKAIKDLVKDALVA